MVGKKESNTQFKNCSIYGIFHFHPAKETKTKKSTKFIFIQRVNAAAASVNLSSLWRKSNVKAQTVFKFK